MARVAQHKDLKHGSVEVKISFTMRKNRRIKGASQEKKDNCLTVTTVSFAVRSIQRGALCICSRNRRIAIMIAGLSRGCCERRRLSPTVKMAVAPPKSHAPAADGEAVAMATGLFWL